MIDDQPNSEPPTLHIVVFDVNIYLDIARSLPVPFSWAALSDMAAKVASDAVPHPKRAEYDSLRAVAVCRSGIFAGLDTLQVWTSAHIDGLVQSKASQSNDPRLIPERRGLGWSKEHSEALTRDLVWEIVTQSNGGTVGAFDIPSGNPPLSHEDGFVYAAAERASDSDALCERYLVTRDVGVLKAEMRGYVRRLHPAQFVGLIRSVRRQAMGGPGAPSSPSR